MREGINFLLIISRHHWVVAAALDGIMLAESSNFIYEETIKLTVASTVSTVLTATKVKMNNALAREIKLMASSIDTNTNNMNDTKYWIPKGSPNFVASHWATMIGPRQLCYHPASYQPLHYMYLPYPQNQ